MEAYKKIPLSEADVLSMFDLFYQNSITGISPASPAVKETVRDYMARFSSADEVCRAIILDQAAKCSASGFLSGLGGFLTIPATLPANIGTVIYWQTRMVLCVACVFGFDIESESTKALVLSCLAGLSLDDVKRKMSVSCDDALSFDKIKNIDSYILDELKEVASKNIITKYSTKSLVNLGNLIPGIGAVIGGSVDLADTKALGERARSWFKGM